MATFHIQGPELSQSTLILFGGDNLSGFEIDFELQWLSRLQFWQLAIVDVRKERIIDGIRVVNGTDMLFPYSDLRLPPGQLICYDGLKLYQDPGRNDWRERHSLLYVEPDDAVPVQNFRIVIPPPDPE